MRTDTEWMETSELWRAIGRLESDNATLKQGQREIAAALEANSRRIDNANCVKHGRFNHDTRRIDWLFYATVAMGGALVIAIFASRFVGG